MKAKELVERMAHEGRCSPELCHTYKIPTEEDDLGSYDCEACTKVRLLPIISEFVDGIENPYEGERIGKFIRSDNPDMAIGFNKAIATIKAELEKVK